MGQGMFKYFYSASLKYFLDAPTMQVMIIVLLLVLSLPVY